MQTSPSLTWMPALSSASTRAPWTSRCLSLLPLLVRCSRAARWTCLFCRWLTSRRRLAASPTTSWSLSVKSAGWSWHRMATDSASEPPPTCRWESTCRWSLWASSVPDSRSPTPCQCSPKPSLRRSSASFWPPPERPPPRSPQATRPSPSSPLSGFQRRRTVRRSEWRLPSTRWSFRCWWATRLSRSPQ